MSNGIVTAILLAAFTGGAFWLFAVRRAADFDRLARIPLDEPQNAAPNAEEAP